MSLGAFPLSSVFESFLCVWQNSPVKLCGPGFLGSFFSFVCFSYYRLFFTSSDQSVQIILFLLDSLLVIYINGNPLQYSCLGNPMDRGAWWATVHRVTKELDTTQPLKNNDGSLQKLVHLFQVVECWCIIVHSILLQFSCISVVSFLISPISPYFVHLDLPSFLLGEPGHRFTNFVYCLK